MKWYLPTFYGDIRLELVEGTATTLSRVLVIAEKLLPTEQAAMGTLRMVALRDKWTTEADWPEDWYESESYRTAAHFEVTLATALSAVLDALSTELKPGSKLLHAVRFADGRIEETHGAATNAPTAKAGATVAQPTRGCPMPDFEKAEVRATRVLEAFLSADQLADYSEHNAFVVTGSETGHRYLVKSRHMPDRMRNCFGGHIRHGGMSAYGSLYDLDEERPLCVHDWTVPAPEEMLSLMLCVTLRETYVRELPAE